MGLMTEKRVNPGKKPRLYQVNEPRPLGTPTPTEIPGHTLAHEGRKPPFRTKVKHMGRKKKAAEVIPAVEASGASVEAGEVSTEAVEASGEPVEATEVPKAVAEAAGGAPEAPLAPLVSPRSPPSLKLDGKLRDRLSAKGLLHRTGRVQKHNTARHIDGEEEHHKLFQSIAEYWRNHPIDADDLMAIAHAVLKIIT